jgi:hypothetical protein
VLRRANPKPRLDWADRVVFAALIRLGSSYRSNTYPVSRPTRTRPDHRPCAYMSSRYVHPSLGALELGDVPGPHLVRAPRDQLGSCARGECVGGAARGFPRRWRAAGTSWRSSTGSPRRRAAAPWGVDILGDDEQRALARSVGPNPTSPCVTRRSWTPPLASAVTSIASGQLHRPHPPGRPHPRAALPESRCGVNAITAKAPIRSSRPGHPPVSRWEIGFRCRLATAAMLPTSATPLTRLTSAVLDPQRM